MANEELAAEAEEIEAAEKRVSEDFQ